MMRILVVLASGLAATACATATSTVGDAMRGDAAVYDGLADNWADAAKLEERGDRMVATGENKIRRGNDRIENGRRDVRRGEELIRDGESEVAEGARMSREGRLLREAAETEYRSATQTATEVAEGG